MKNHWLRLVAGVVLAAGCSTPVQQQAATPDPVADGLRQLRAATLPFKSLDSAVAAGYPRIVADCLIHEHHGAMGYHHVNRANLDAVVDVAHPEILLYEKLADGSYRLNGVEFIVPYRAWPRDSVAPTLMGRAMKREDNLKFWYTHVWAWTDNPDGVFADFHPAVTCPADNRKIYRSPTE